MNKLWAFVLVPNRLTHQKARLTKAVMTNLANTFGNMALGNMAVAGDEVIKKTSCYMKMAKMLLQEEITKVMTTIIVAMLYFGENFEQARNCLDIPS